MGELLVFGACRGIGSPIFMVGRGERPSSNQDRVRVRPEFELEWPPNQTDSCPEYPTTPRLVPTIRLVTDRIGFQGSDPLLWLAPGFPVTYDLLGRSSGGPPAAGRVRRVGAATDMETREHGLACMLVPSEGKMQRQDALSYSCLACATVAI
ncbi:hypothetical protein PVAP13_1NG043000 [Panicum virgatum]|uniref:Uncharacterized protein n=1 Tax=Panicum virgatum TaxID=38727 RepID=A0A8T0WPX1_PANVG|nr:hypothetical protein PVAP13_1NG043000 [Panicum virgatum]